MSPSSVPELLLDLLFEPFKTRKEGGSGIGLRQLKRVATSLGETISAENKLDDGAQFEIRLPLAEGVESFNS